MTAQETITECAKTIAECEKAKAHFDAAMAEAQAFVEWMVEDMKAKCQWAQLARDIRAIGSTSGYDLGAYGR